MILLKYGAGEDSWESLDQQGDKPTNPKKSNPRYLLEGLMMKLKLQYFGHLMWRADSLEKTLMLGKIESRKKRVWQKMKLLDGITDSMDMTVSNLWKRWRTGKPGVLQSMESQRFGHDWVTTQEQQQQSNSWMGRKYLLKMAQKEHLGCDYLNS